MSGAEGTTTTCFEKDGKRMPSERRLEPLVITLQNSGNHDNTGFSFRERASCFFRPAGVRRV